VASTRIVAVFIHRNALQDAPRRAPEGPGCDSQARPRTQLHGLDPRFARPHGAAGYAWLARLAPAFLRRATKATSPSPASSMAPSPGSGTADTL
jgi:hypothetical protein